VLARAVAANFYALVRDKSVSSAGDDRGKQKCYANGGASGTIEMIIRT